MEALLQQKAYDFVHPKDKAFIIAFDAEMNRLGYTCNKTIGEGYCWGRKMIIYTKAGVKSKKSYARIYMREHDLILRMYFSNIDKQRQAIEQAPEYIQQASLMNMEPVSIVIICLRMGPADIVKHIRYTADSMNSAMGLPFGFFRLI